MSRRCDGLTAVALVACSALVGQACGGSTTTEPATVNNPPVIQSIAAGSVNVEADQSVQLTATVSDVESATSQLVYQWDSIPTGGTFAGTGSQVRWKAPASTPEVYTITLTVTESFKADGVTKENRVSSSLQVRYNDLMVRALAGTFLNDFGNASMNAAQCVRNFSDTLCSGGKAEEFEQVAGNRARTGVHVEGAAFQIDSITFNAAQTQATILAPCAFFDRFDDGSRQPACGTCRMTAVYDGPRWYLCTSNFDRPFVCAPGLAGTAASSAPSHYAHP